ncbi:MAG: hypothetical protein KDA89_25110, partial [Planctomycetaceae bacterium]|nr:hypothetical protein [Planctomycetaceae bacterium]
MEIKKQAIVGILAAIVFVSVPTPAHAQQTSEEIIALLEQILKLTQLVLALQTQLDALEAAQATMPPSSITQVPAPSGTSPKPPQYQNEAQQQNVPVADTNRVLQLPLNIYLVQSGYEVIQAQTTPDELVNSVSLMNSRYWSQANIQWQLGSVGFHAIQNGSDTTYVEALLSDNKDLASAQLGNFSQGATVNAPFNVFIVHDLGGIPYNGWYSSNGTAVISETNSREAGVNYITYLLAHELGHALGLPHEGTFYNLMHEGRGGIEGD